MENPASELAKAEALRAEGKPAEAEAVLDRLPIPATPADAAAIASLRALIRVDQNRYDEALEHFSKAADLAPADLQHLTNLALINTVLGRNDGAEAAFRRSLLQAPGHAPLLDGLANALQAQGKLEEAIATYRQAIVAAPQNAGIWYNLGNALFNALRPKEAVEAYNNAILLQPTMAGAHLNRGNALKELGQLEDALAAFRSARCLEPGNPLAASNMLVTLPFLSGIDPDEQLNEFCIIGHHMTAQAKDRVRPHSNSRDPERPLNIGYLSPNFRDHLMARSLLPLIRAHDRGHFRIHIFGHVPKPDAMTAEFASLVDSFTHIETMSDDYAADLVRNAGIDILVHSMGHWGDNRLGVFASKPAPIQVSYLGNSPTTGMPVFDYLITDAVLGPNDHLAVMIPEKPVYLKSGFSVYSYGPDVKIAPPPSTLGHPFTFASFNNPQKISDACLALWAAVMKAVPSARLALKGLNLQDKAAQAHMLQRLGQVGIEAGRVVMLGQLATYVDHLDAFNSVDAILDTTPFTGGATTLDAFWMGVPVISRVGALMFGRYSYDYMMRLGVDELAAFDDETYVSKAVELAGNSERLSAYRQTLRGKMQVSSLLDAGTHARELEAAYRGMWRNWCVGGSAKSFHLT